MTYIQQDWTDSVSVFNAARANHIEDGIAAAHLRTGRRLVTVAGADESSLVKASADYVATGAGDHEVINQAIDDVAETNLDKGGNGGLVALVGREFNISGPIRLRSQSELFGAYGKQGTWVTNAGYTPGAEGGTIELADDDTQYTTLRDIGLNGAGVDACGIYHRVGLAQEYDAFHTVDNIYIWNPGQHGLYVRQGASSGQKRNRGNMYSRIRMINPGQYGVYSLCPDSFYNMVDVGSAGSHGFMCAHSNNRYVNCKAWYSDGDGFHIAGGRDNQLNTCESQDNQGHGFYIGSGRTSLSSCCADSNGHGGDGTADGFWVGGHGANVHGTASDKNEGGRGLQQRYGVNIAGSPRVIVNVTCWQNKTAASNGNTGAAGSVVNVVDSD